ncbi:MAG: thioesterase family protein [Aeromicrobium sp.]
MSDDYYAIDTASVPRGDGIRDLTLTSRWNTPLGKPNGGYILAAMLRGLGEELDADDPMVASISYLKSPEPGPGELHTKALRLGRRVQTGEVTLVQNEATVAHLVANFGPRGEGRTHELGTPPKLPPPDSCVDPRTQGMPEDGIFGRIDYRLATRPGWAEGKPNGDPSVELWQRLADGREIDFTALAILVDSYAPPVLELGEVQSMTVQLTVHLHRKPVPGWLATRLTTRHVINGYHEEDCELWDEAGNLVAQSRQFAILL